MTRSPGSLPSHAGRRALRAALLLIVLSCARPAWGVAQTGWAGHWVGSMQRGGATLPIAIDFPAHRPGQGFFTAGDLGAMDVPLSSIRLEAPARAHWELVGDETTTVFTGERTGSVLRGTFTEGDSRGSFVLRRTSVSTDKPYTRREVRFSNADVTLAGTLLVPRTPGRHPGIVFLHGSGPEGRWANGFLADYVARRGIVALIYDKRGVGGSAGDWRKSTLEDLAADAKVAVHLLAVRPEVDPRSVGVLGHSQGGFIAPIVASDNPEVRWIIDADGNAGPQFEQDLYRVETALAKAYSGDELAQATALYREFVDVARNGLPHAHLYAEAARHASARWLHALALPDDTSWIWGWYRGVGNDDDSDAWRSVRVPVLLLYGGDDEIVPPDSSIARIERLLHAGHDPAHTVRVFPRADHTLRLPPAVPQGWPRYAEGFPDVVVEWISRRPGASATVPAP